MNQDKFNTFIYRAVSEGIKRLERKDINMIASYLLHKDGEIISSNEVELLVKKYKKALLNYAIEEIQN